MQESSPEFAEHFWSQDESLEAGNCPRGSSIVIGDKGNGGSGLGQENTPRDGDRVDESDVVRVS